MPSKNPRMMLTVKPATLAMVQRVAKPLGVPAATFVSQLLDEMSPLMEGMAQALIAAKEKRLEAFDHLSETLGAMQVQAGQLQLDMSRTRRRVIVRERKKAAKKSARKAAQK